MPCNITLKKEVLRAINLNLSVTMDRYIRYYVNQSGGVEIGHVYRASFRVHRGNSLGSYFRGLFRIVKHLLYSGAKSVGQEALKTVSNIITEFLNMSQNSLWAIFSKLVLVKQRVTFK